MADKYKFTYPDIPYCERTLYDYFFSIGQVIRAQGNAVQELAARLDGNRRLFDSVDNAEQLIQGNTDRLDEIGEVIKEHEDTLKSINELLKEHEEAISKLDEAIKGLDASVKDLSGKINNANN